MDDETISNDPLHNFHEGVTAQWLDEGPWQCTCAVLNHELGDKRLKSVRTQEEVPILPSPIALQASIRTCILTRINGIPFSRYSVRTTRSYRHCHRQNSVLYGKTNEVFGFSTGSCRATCSHRREPAEQNHQIQQVRFTRELSVPVRP